MPEPHAAYNITIVYLYNIIYYIHGTHYIHTHYTYVQYSIFFSIRIFVYTFAFYTDKRDLHPILFFLMCVYNTYNVYIYTRVLCVYIPNGGRPARIKCVILTRRFPLYCSAETGLRIKIHSHTHTHILCICVFVL